MASQKQKVTGSSFIQFLESLHTGNADNSQAMEILKEKLMQERVSVMESKLRDVANDMQSFVTQLRNLRKTETKIKKAIKDLEVRAQMILDGTDESDADQD